jgi:hypothetical protein
MAKMCWPLMLGDVYDQVEFVMAGLVPAIHVLTARKTWMPGPRPGMTVRVG